MMYPILRRLIPLAVGIVLLAGCCGVQDVQVTGISGVTLKGLSGNAIQLELELEVSNPNNRRIVISEVYFQSWMNNREFGTLRTTDRIELKPCSQASYPVLIALELRTMADALRIITTPPEALLRKLEVEGHIKGRAFPARRTIRVPRQSFRELIDSW